MNAKIIFVVHAFAGENSASILPEIPCEHRHIFFKNFSKLSCKYGILFLKNILLIDADG